MGGLGNQLFQIFTTISLAIECKQPFKFLDAKELGNGTTKKRFTFWENFFHKLKPFLINEFPKPFIVIREKKYR